MGDATILRLVRLLRLARMTRVAKLLRAFPEVLIMIKGLVPAWVDRFGHDTTLRNQCGRIFWDILRYPSIQGLKIYFIDIINGHSHLFAGICKVEIWWFKTPVTPSGVMMPLVFTRNKRRNILWRLRFGKFLFWQPSAAILRMRVWPASPWTCLIYSQALAQQHGQSCSPFVCWFWLGSQHEILDLSLSRTVLLDKWPPSHSSRLDAEFPGALCFWYRLQTDLRWMLGIDILLP